MGTMSNSLWSAKRGRKVGGGAVGMTPPHPPDPALLEAVPHTQKQRWCGSPSMSPSVTDADDVWAKAGTAREG